MTVQDAFSGKLRNAVNIFQESRKPKMSGRITVDRLHCYGKSQTALALYVQRQWAECPCGAIQMKPEAI
jgi:hypothetical protein